MTKVERCPDCGERLYDRWTGGRKLQQRCVECGWRGEPRVPEKMKIESTVKVRVGPFYGFRYEIFDKYGYVMTSSRYYITHKEALKELKDELERSNRNPDVAPCTGILWPDSVTVEGEVLK